MRVFAWLLNIKVMVAFLYETPLITLIPFRLHAHFILHVLFNSSKLDFIPIYEVVSIF